MDQSTASSEKLGHRHAKAWQMWFAGQLLADVHELRFLARAYAATKDDRYRVAVEKGIDYILKAQYPTGGWPQYYPPGTKYHRHITFNDDAMVRLMEFLRETATSDRYAFLDAGRKEAARRAFARGVQCILKCQIRVNGKLTAWCAQHDEKDFSPRPGRTFEPAVKLGSGTWKLEACPMDGGALAIDQRGAVVTVWRRETDVFLASPGRPEERLATGHDPVIAVAGDGGWSVAWQGEEGLLIRDAKHAAPRLLAEGGQAPALLALPDGSLLAAWEREKRVFVAPVPR